MTGTKWEYNMIFFDATTQATEKTFNQLGNEGWEAIDVHVAGFNGASSLTGWAFFKRQKVDVRIEKKLVDNGLGEHGLW